MELRTNGEDFVTKKEGESLQNKINANTFIECSSKQNLMIKEVIEAAVKASDDGIPEKRGGYFASKLCRCFY